MNWKRFFLNLAGVAAGGFASGLAAAPAGTPNAGKILAGAVVMPVLANVVGLFQQPPHADGQ